jgi:hypothetical protein
VIVTGQAAGRDPGVRLPRKMGLEEHSVETAGDHCEECGAPLTPAEIATVLESGGPTLCAIHAAEDEPGLAAGEAEPAPD